ncbi:MAG: carboxypeptidase-like regulatory domain-containing protein, partial [Vulcanimicrobiaceae bacterium]
MHTFPIRILLAAIVAAVLVRAAPVLSAESTTGTIVGTVAGATGEPVANARISASSPSGRYVAATDARGRFSLFGLISDTYSVSVAAAGYQAAARDGVTVLPGENQHIAFTLMPTLKTIASVRSTSRSFAVGSTSDTFTVSASQARASAPSESSSGLANYTQGTVQGAVSAVPGVDEDSFANV